MNKPIAAALLLALAALNPLAGGAQSANAPYKIGVTYPLTGPLALNSANVLAGADIAVADINKAGGINGHPVQLAIEDSQGTPQGGISSMRKLVDIDGVQAILTIFTNVVTAQMPLADQLKIPMLSTVETSGLVSKSQYSFAHAQAIGQEAPLLRDYWKGAGYKRIFAFYGNNAYGQNVAVPIKAAAVAAGVGAYDEAFFDMNDTDYRGVVARAKEFKPDAIVLCAQGSAAETTMLKQIRELGITAQIFNPSNFFFDKGWRDAAGTLADGMIFTGANVDGSSAAGRDFIREYRAKTGVDPGYQPAEAYDIIKLFAYSIGKSSYNGEAIRNVLATVKGVPSVLGGTITMGADHYTVGEAAALWQARGNGEVKITPPRK
jgi:branched-chain amino acid transport system substrate-binding protein